MGYAEHAGGQGLAAGGPVAVEAWSVPGGVGTAVNGDRPLCGNPSPGTPVVASKGSETIDPRALWTPAVSVLTAPVGGGFKDCAAWSLDHNLEATPSTRS